MSDAFTKREFVAGLASVLQLAVGHQRLDDAETVLTAVRILRPQLAELDMFEAWIATKRGFWQDAMRISNSLVARSDWPMAKAFLACCQSMVGNPAWRNTAQDVLDNSTNTEALDMVKALLDPDLGKQEKKEEPEVQAPLTVDVSHYAFMRV
jgi:type III secretion protein HrpB1